MLCVDSCMHVVGVLYVCGIVVCVVMCFCMTMRVGEYICGCVLYVRCVTFGFL